MLYVRLRDRNHAHTAKVPPVTFTVDSYSHHARMGPDKARLSAAGNINDLFALTGILRYNTEIYDDLGETVWWGYVNEVRIQTASVEYIVSLTEMANDVAVTYSTRGAGQGGSSSAGTTAFSDDTESVNAFGRKQKLLSGQSNTAQSALKLRDVALAELKFPIVQSRFNDADEIQAEVHCLGWWHTLDWNVEYAIPATNEVGPLSHTAGQAFANSTIDKVGQTLTISSGADSRLDAIDVWLKKVGGPTGSVLAGIYNSGSTPGSAIATVSLVSDSISVDFTPETFDLSTSSEVASGGSYWIVVEATGGTTDADNYYEVGINQDGLYAGGQLQTLSGATWSSSASSDMAFVVAGTRATSDQMENLLDDADAGQFFTGHKVDAITVQKPKLDSSNTMTARAIMETLIELGSSGGNRLTVEVTPARRVVIESERTAGTENYYITSDMVFRDRVGAQIPKAHIHRVVRRWVTPQDIASVLSQSQHAADFENIFVEWVEYDASRDAVRPRAKDARGDFDIVRLVDR